MINQSIKPFDFFLKTRAIGRCLCLGGGQCLTQTSFLSCIVARKFCFGLIGGLGACSLGKFLKERIQDWLKMHFPRIQLGKLDKNKSAHSLALKFGCLKNCLLALGRGELLPCPPASYSPEN